MANVAGIDKSDAVWKEQSNIKENPLFKGKASVEIACIPGGAELATVRAKTPTAKSVRTQASDAQGIVVFGETVQGEEKVSDSTPIKNQEGNGNVLQNPYSPPENKGTSSFNILFARVHRKVPKQYNSILKKHKTPRVVFSLFKLK